MSLPQVEVGRVRFVRPAPRGLGVDPELRDGKADGNKASRVLEKQDYSIRVL